MTRLGFTGWRPARDIRVYFCVASGNDELIEKGDASSYELFVPSLLQKRLLRLILKIDARLGKPLRRRLDAVEEKMFAEAHLQANGVRVN